MIPKEMIEAAKQIVLERLGSVLNFHGKPVVYSVMSGIEDIIEDALTAALSVQWRGIADELETLAKDCEDCAEGAEAESNYGDRRAWQSVAQRIRFAVKKMPLPPPPAQE